MALDLKTLKDLIGNASDTSSSTGSIFARIKQVISDLVTHSNGKGNNKHVPSAGSNGEFLAHDGTYKTPPDTNTHRGISDAIDSESSVISASSKAVKLVNDKVDEISSAGGMINKHVLYDEIITPDDVVVEGNYGRLQIPIDLTKNGTNTDTTGMNMHVFITPETIDINNISRYWRMSITTDGFITSSYIAPLNLTNNVNNKTQKLFIYNNESGYMIPLHVYAYSRILDYNRDYRDVYSLSKSLVSPFNIALNNSFGIQIDNYHASDNSYKPDFNIRIKVLLDTY